MKYASVKNKMQKIQQLISVYKLVDINQLLNTVTPALSSHSL